MHCVSIITHQKTAIQAEPQRHSRERLIGREMALYMYMEMRSNGVSGISRAANHGARIDRVARVNDDRSRGKMCEYDCELPVAWTVVSFFRIGSRGVR